MNTIVDTYAFDTLEMPADARKTLKDPDFLLAFKLPIGSDKDIIALTVYRKAGWGFRQVNAFQVHDATGLLAKENEIVQVIMPDGTLSHNVVTFGKWRWF